MKTGQQKAPDRLEWDFSSCPDDELFVCHGYEFAREFPHVCQWASDWRRRLPGKTFDDWVPSTKREHGRRLLTRTDLAPVIAWNLFACYPEWPEHPYLSIPEAERQRRLKLLPKIHQPKETKHALRLIHLPDLLKEYSEPLPPGWTRELPPQDRFTVKTEDGFHETVAFTIDWRHQDGPLREQFALWLNKLRPKEISTWPNKGMGRTANQFRIRLKALGALRLLCVMTWKEAADSTAEQSPTGKPLFVEQAGWIRAKKDCEKYLGEVASH